MEEPPSEMPPELIAEAERNVNVRWYNEKTDEYVWEDPALRSPWREVRAENVCVCVCVSGALLSPSSLFPRFLGDV